MNIFKRAGAFLAREYQFIPITCQRGIESVAFTAAGVGSGELVNTYSNLPFAHTVAGTMIGAVTLVPLLRMIQIYFIARANTAKADSGLPISVPSVPCAPCAIPIQTPTQPPPPAI